MLSFVYAQPQTAFVVHRSHIRGFIFQINLASFNFLRRELLHECKIIQM